MSILTWKFTDDDRRAELAKLTPGDIKNKLITILQLICARQLWRCSKHEAEKRLWNGEIPNDKDISQSEEARKKYS